MKALQKVGIANDNRSQYVYERFLTTFEKTSDHIKQISLNKLLTAILLLCKDASSDKITYLFGIY